MNGTTGSTFRRFAGLMVALACVASTAAPQVTATPAEARKIAAEAYLYGFPVYVGGFLDADGQPVDASKGRYTLRFPKGGLPPNDAFWSLTMYDGTTQLLVANPLERYLINSSMQPRLQRDADGAITLYVQTESPGADQEANWLPAPRGPFYTILRIYQPKPEVQSGKWKAPPLRRATDRGETPGRRVWTVQPNR